MKQLIILFLLLFTCVFSQTKTDFEVHNLKLDEIIRLDDFLLQHYSDSYWQVEIRLSNVSKSQYVEWVNIRYNFWQSGQIVGSEYSYLDYDTYENTGLKPDSFGLIQSLTEIISFDSINFDIEYYFHEGSNLSLYEKALKLSSTNFQDLSYSKVYSKWIGAVLNDTNTPIKYPKIFACFFLNGKIIDLEYTYLDVSNSALEPRKTGYFDTLIILPAEYDSVKYYTHYSISLSGTIDLPVELTDFSVQLHEDNIELTWSTLAEKNNYAFEIERKIEAKDWERISLIYGKGTTNERTNYKYEDRCNGNGLYHYRLCQIDFDGSSTISNEISILVENQPTKLELFQNYPNPFNGLTRFEFQLETSQNISMEIYDEIGRLVTVLFSGYFETGLHSFNFDAENLPSGCYFCVLRGQSQQVIKKILLIK